MCSLIQYAVESAVLLKGHGESPEPTQWGKSLKGKASKEELAFQLDLKGQVGGGERMRRQLH